MKSCSIAFKEPSSHTRNLIVVHALVLSHICQHFTPVNPLFSVPDLYDIFVPAGGSTSTSLHQQGQIEENEGKVPAARENEQWRSLFVLFLRVLPCVVYFLSKYPSFLQFMIWLCNK